MSNRTSSLLTLVFASAFLISIGFLTHNAFADTVIATIPLGTTATSADPMHVEVNPNTNMVYVSSGNSIYMINGETNMLVGTIPIGMSSYGIAVNQNTNMIYDGGSTGVIVINGTTNSIVTQIPNTDSVVAINPNTDMIYVSGPTSIKIIDGTDNTVVSMISVPSFAHKAVINPVANMIYVPLGGTLGKLIQIDGVSNSVVNRTTFGLIGSIAVNPNTNKIYVDTASGARSWLGIFDGSTMDVINAIPNLYQDDIVANPTANKIYAPNSDYNRTYVIDGSTDNVINTIQNLDPEEMAINPTTNKIYAPNVDSDTVSVIDSSTDNVINTLTVGCGCGIGMHAVAVNPNTNRVYVVNEGSGTVSVIDGNPRQLRVNSQDSYGNPLPDYYTELYAPDGTQIDSGYTQYNFTLETDQNYTVHVENYGKYKFNHWLDTGSTNASRIISITSDRSITAVYATIPTHPSNLTATAVSPSEIDLSWNAPSSDGGSPITAYRIQSSTDGSTWTTLVKNTGNTGTTYSDTGLDPNTTYYYRVFALNSVGSSYRSNVASATTPIFAVAGTNVGSATLP